MLFCVVVCVYLSSGFRGQCFNHAIPIAKSYPPMTSLPYGLVVLPLRTPGGVWREGLPTSSCILVGTPWQLLNAVPQPRSLSRQVFIAALVERAVLTIRARLCMAFWALGDRHPAHFARVRWRSRNQVPILYGETRRPHSMRAKARTQIHYGLMCGEWTDTGAKVTNVSQGFVLSPPSGGFEPRTFVS